MSLVCTPLKITSSSINISTLSLILVEKILNYYWISENKTQLSLYKNLGNKVYIRGLITYTSFGSYCLFLISLYELLKNKEISPELLNYSWSILFSVTSGYYLYVLPGVISSPDPKNWFLNIFCHGPYLAINTYKLFYRYPQVMNVSYSQELKYCLLYSYGWLLLVWLPWYHLTDDFIYPPLNSKYSLKKRLLNISKMSLLLAGGVTVKHIVYNKLIKEK